MTERPSASVRFPITRRMPECRSLLADEYEAIVREIYRAGAGIVTWVAPLDRIAEASAASNVSLGAFDKQSGRVIFSYAGGPRPPEAATEYIRKYHRTDPRIALIKPWPVGKWLACQDHFDDDYVSRNSFYQDFLLRYGSRYVYGAKLLEDATTMVVFAHHRPPGNPLVDPGERGALERLGVHIAQALQIQHELNSVMDRDALGYALLDRLHQPVVLLDRDRMITFCSDVAKEILERCDVVCEHHGFLVCHNQDSDVALTLALRELTPVLSESEVLRKTLGERRTLRLHRTDSSRIVIVTLLALRLPAANGMIGCRSRVLLVIHEPKAATEVDPALLASVFTFTPAEARVAARLSSGHTSEEIAAEFNISITTVRTQLKALFDKTGTNRQADLMQMLLAATAL